MADLIEQIGRTEESFGRDAAAEQARTAELRVLLDDRGLETELSGPDGGNVSARATPDDGHIEDFAGSQDLPPVRSSMAHKRRFRALSCWRLSAVVNLPDAGKGQWIEKCE